MLTPNSKSSLGGKGVKSKLSVKTIETKYRANMEVEQGEKSKSTIAKDIGVQFNALSTWLKKKEIIIDAYQQFNPKRKNARTYTFHDVETDTLKWRQKHPNIWPYVNSQSRRIC